MRHVLTEVVGVRPNLEPSFEMFDLLPGEAFLLCSDGLHGVLPNDRLAACFGPGEVKAIAVRLVSEAVGRGANDNVTAVVVRRDS
jgi:serine/threonine protein phosphatase PrpC